MAATMLNMYPVKVTTADGSIMRNCRMVFEGDVTTVYRWDQELATAVPVLNAPGQPQRIGATAAYEVDGRRIDPQRGCGCSHPMYAWVPPA